MSLHISATTGCNLGCDYCYENPERERKQEWVDRQYDMDEIMEKLRDWKEMYPNEPPGMHGGEPLLVRKDDLETVFEWVHENYDGQGSHIQTNGTLMDEEHVEMFEKYNVDVGISCDGPEELNRLRKAAGERGSDQTDATDNATAKTHDAVEMVAESDATLGIITVLNEQNAGTEEKFETLLDWIDDLCRKGVHGHFNPAIPYEEVSPDEDVALSRQRLKECFLRAWEWMKEEPHREWGPMRDYKDNLLGNQLSDCVNNKCDVANAGAAKIIKGNGETTGCFDDQTELLTNDGWKFVSEVTSSDEIATVHPETWEMEFANPVAIQSYEYDDDLISWQSGQVDIAVTPDHTMVAKPTRRGEWTDMDARGIASYAEPTFKPTPAGSADGLRPNADDILPINGVGRVDLPTDIEQWMDFLGWYMAEGYTYKDEYRVTIAQDSEHTDDVVEMLGDMGASVQSHNNEHSIHSKALYQIVEQFGLCDEKYVPQWIKSLHPDLIERFLHAMMKGDGHINNGRWVKYTTTSEQLADDAQELLLRIGKGAKKIERDGTTTGGKKCYDVTITNDTPEQSRFTDSAERVSYNGMVYDVTVPPYHTLVTRRNGTTAILGNCGKTWAQYGDGEAFLQGESNNSQYDEDTERYQVLKETPGWATEGMPDMGGCKGCKYWNVCQGGCPGAGQNDDYRNRSHFCKAKYALYEQIEEDMRNMFPNIRLITDLPWNAEVADAATSWQLDIKPFAAMRPGIDGKSSVNGGYNHNFGSAEDCIPDGAMPEKSFDQQVREYKEQYPEETVEVDRENNYLHADSAKAEDGAGWSEQEQ